MLFEPNWKKMRENALKMGLDEYLRHKIKNDLFISSDLNELYSILYTNINDKMELEFDMSVEEFTILMNEIKKSNNPTYKFKRVYDDYHYEDEDWGAYEIEIGFLDKQFLLKSVSNGSDLEFRTYVCIEKDDEDYEFEVYYMDELTGEYSIFILDDHINLKKILNDIYFGTKKEHKTYKLPVKSNKKRFFFSK